MDMHPPTNEELATLPQVTFTSDKVWDPSIIDYDMDLEKWMATLNSDGPTAVTSSAEPPPPPWVNQFAARRDNTDDILITGAGNTDIYSSQKFDATTTADDDPFNAVNNKPVPTGLPDQHDRPRKRPHPMTSRGNVNIGSYLAREEIALLHIKGEGNPPIIMVLTRD